MSRNRPYLARRCIPGYLVCTQYIICLFQYKKEARFALLWKCPLACRVPVQKNRLVIPVDEQVGQGFLQIDFRVCPRNAVHHAGIPGDRHDCALDHGRITQKLDARTLLVRAHRDIDVRIQGDAVGCGEEVFRLSGCSLCRNVPANGGEVECPQDIESHCADALLKQRVVLELRKSIPYVAVSDKSGAAYRIKRCFGEDRRGNGGQHGSKQRKDQFLHGNSSGLKRATALCHEMTNIIMIQKL